MRSSVFLSAVIFCATAQQLWNVQPQQLNALIFGNTSRSPDELIRALLDEQTKYFEELEIAMRAYNAESARLRALDHTIAEKAKQLKITEAVDRFIEELAAGRFPLIAHADLEVRMRTILTPQEF